MEQAVAVFPYESRKGTGRRVNNGAALTTDTVVPLHLGRVGKAVGSQPYADRAQLAQRSATGRSSVRQAIHEPGTLTTRLNPWRLRILAAIEAR